MEFSFNPMSFLHNDLIKNKVDFINKYGDLSNTYNHLTPLGEQKNTWVYFIGFFSLILSIICFMYSKKSNETIKNQSLKTIIKISAWLLLGIFIVCVIYGGYTYFFLYSPQYNEWFKNLPVDAQKKISAIRALSMISQQNSNRATLDANRIIIK